MIEFLSWIPGTPSSPSAADGTGHPWRKKSRRGGTPSGIPPRRHTRQRTPQHCRVALQLVIRRPQPKSLAEAVEPAPALPRFLHYTDRNAVNKCIRVPRSRLRCWTPLEMLEEMGGARNLPPRRTSAGADFCGVFRGEQSAPGAAGPGGSDFSPRASRGGGSVALCRKGLCHSNLQHRVKHGPASPTRQVAEISAV